MSAWNLLQQVNYGLEIQDFLGIMEKIPKNILSRDLSAKLKTEAIYENFVEEQKCEIAEIKRDEKLDTLTFVNAITENSHFLLLYHHFTLLTWKVRTHRKVPAKNQ